MYNIIITVIVIHCEKYNSRHHSKDIYIYIYILISLPIKFVRTRARTTCHLSPVVRLGAGGSLRG